MIRTVPQLFLVVRQDSGESGIFRGGPGESVAIRDNSWYKLFGGIRGREATLISRSSFASRMDQVPPCCRQRYHFVSSQIRSNGDSPRILGEKCFRPLTRSPPLQRAGTSW